MKVIFSGYYRNNKSGETYKVNVDHKVTNATNDRSGQEMVIYERNGKNMSDVSMSFWLSFHLLKKISNTLLTNIQYV